MSASRGSPVGQPAFQPAFEPGGYVHGVAETFYRRISEFEPLLPQRGRDALVEQAREVTVRSLGLVGAAHPTTMSTLRDLLHEMNSYYSNRIERQSTHPLDIARALRSDYSSTASIARLQRLAVAHINAERNLEGVDTATALTMGFLRRAHAELYNNLPVDDRETHDGKRIDPGNYRTLRVQVGNHTPPEPDVIPAFADRFDEVYGRRTSLDETLVAVSAAHQRASWIHPFEDGNGRATRLQTHCALFPITHGIWSVSRGLARNQDDYYRYLAGADAHRAGDLDGRGNLSDRGLAGWCEWFISICLDQVDFMKSMLNLDSIQRRIHALLIARSSEDQKYRIETARALFHLFATGPMPRGEFSRMTGLGERTARLALSHLLDVGLVTSSDHRAPVRIALPLDALLFLFPDLYPEVETKRKE